MTGDPKKKTLLEHFETCVDGGSIILYIKYTNTCMKKESNLEYSLMHLMQVLYTQAIDIHVKANIHLYI